MTEPTATSDDAELLALGEQLMVAQGAERDDTTAAIIRRIESIPARSLAGLQVKAWAIVSCLDGESISHPFGVSTDARLLAAIIRELRAL